MVIYLVESMKEVNDLKKLMVILMVTGLLLLSLATVVLAGYESQAG
jgi:hypothetical protein